MTYKDFVSKFKGQKGKLVHYEGWPYVEFKVGLGDSHSIIEVGEDYVVFGYVMNTNISYPLSIVSFVYV